MDDLLAEFLSETQESLNTLDQDIVTLERDPSNSETIGGIFRIVHTIKGTCGFLNLTRLGKIAHASESLIRIFREDSSSVTGDRVTLILQSLDRIKGILSALKDTGEEPEEDDSALIAQLETEASLVSGKPPEPAPTLDSEPLEMVMEQESAEGIEIGAAFEDVQQAKGAADKEERPHATSAAEDERTEERIDERIDERTEEEEVELPPKPSLEQALPAVSLVDEKGRKEGKDGGEVDIASVWGGAVAGASAHEGGPLTTLRVRLDLVESMMDSVSELVLIRNQLLQMLRQSPTSEFSSSLQHLNQITTEIQESVMKTRMQPIRNAWNVLPRLVRDLSRAIGKQVDLRTSGEDTELDRQVIEMIRDPLIHLVRNAVDHGLESPEERTRLGKSPDGVIALNAYQEGGQIMIEVEDNGRGLDHEKIRSKVVSFGIMNEAKANTLTTAQLYGFLFQPGFSTADVVTEVSGRGVGMDVVKNNIDKIGGQIELNSSLGVGTQIRIKIPLTLAIVSVLITSVGRHRYALPQISVVELVPFRETQDHKVNVLQGSLVLQLRDKLLPLLSMRKMFELTDPSPLKPSSVAEQANGEISQPPPPIRQAVSEAFEVAPPPPVKEPLPPMHEKGNEEQILKDVLKGPENYVIVVSVGAQQFGLLVEEIHDTEEIVVKSLSPPIRNTSYFSGNTILGDGRVVLILDPNGLAEGIGQFSERIESSHLMVPQTEVAPSESLVTMVMLDTGIGVKKVVPVSAINRLEQLDCARIEYPSASPVVLYNETLMPILTVEEDRKLPTSGRKPILILSDGHRWAGILVEEVLDILNQPLHVERSEHEKGGVIGSAIFKEQSVEVLDMEYFWKRAYRRSSHLLFDQRPALDSSREKQDMRLLLIEDNRAFCDAIIPYLSSAGYRVFVADNVEQAALYHKNAIAFDLILSDVDRGAEELVQFVSRVRHTHNSWTTLPVVGLSAKRPPEEVAEAYRNAGFTDLLSKTDRVQIVEKLQSLGSGALSVRF